MTLTVLQSLSAVLVGLAFVANAVLVTRLRRQIGRLHYQVRELEVELLLRMGELERELARPSSEGLGQGISSGREGGT